MIRRIVLLIIAHLVAVLATEERYSFLRSSIETARRAQVERKAAQMRKRRSMTDPSNKRIDVSVPLYLIC